MKSTLLILFLSIALFSFNCKGSKQTTAKTQSGKEINTSKGNTDTSGKSAIENKDAAIAAQNNASAKTENSATQEKKVFRFTVSFISKGAGTDYQMRQKYDSFLTDFETRNYIKLVLSKASWGREGEMDYCFDMTDLKKDVIDKFIAESKALLSASDRINIGENTNCRGVIK
jgi:hypothetical protein